MGAAPFEAAGPKDDGGDQELNLSSLLQSGSCV